MISLGEIPKLLLATLGLKYLPHILSSIVQPGGVWLLYVYFSPLTPIPTNLLSLLLDNAPWKKFLFTFGQTLLMLFCVASINKYLATKLAGKVCSSVKTEVSPVKLFS